MKLSIIIPVYQVAKTLKRCLDSIISQEFRDWQLILVDDASTDGSEKICDRYAKSEHRIQVVHLKENSGLSVARNTGIAKAKGEYITFVDSDDYIAADTLKTLFEILNFHPDYDILEYPAYIHYGSSDMHRLQFPRKEYTNMTDYWLKGKAYEHSYAWNKIYRRELFDDVTFPEGHNFEDVYTLPKLLHKCHLVATTDCGLYYYCFNPEGITQKADVRDLSHLLEAHTRSLSNILRDMKQRNSRQRNKKAGKIVDKNLGDYYAHIINIQLDVYRAGGRISKYIPMLPYHHTMKLKMLHLVGLKRLCQLHHLLKCDRSSASL